jgi:outer membrane lipoprotein-sorting protein
MNILIKLKNTIPFLILLSYHIAVAENTNDLIQKIQQNLKKLDRAVIEFWQTSTNSSVATGKLLIQRPSFFRCNYYPPYPLLIVGGKEYISMYDYSMETISYISAKDNIMNLLFSADFSKHFIIKDVVKTSQHVALKLIHQESQQLLEAFFDNKSFDLARIVFIGLDGPSIVVEFAKPVMVKKFKKELFEMRDPKIFNAPLHLNKQELEKEYELD